MEDLSSIEPLVRRALEEDIGTGDVTSEAVIPPTQRSKAAMVAKEEGLIAGLEVARLAFRLIDEEIEWESLAEDSQRVRPGDVLAEMEGPTRGLLSAERVALNFLQRLSGIATLTAKYVAAVEGTGAVILDTRKTTPGWRALEKYAVRVGEGHNHRMGLYDMVLIKDNHIRAAGGIAKAVARVRARWGRRFKVEVEATTLAEVEEALAAGVDRIMLDNMGLEEMREAVALVEGRVELEASGGMTLERVREVAETGVDYISVGALTHSAPALDISMEIIEE